MHRHIIDVVMRLRDASTGHNLSMVELEILFHGLANSLNCPLAFNNHSKLMNRLIAIVRDSLSLGQLFFFSRCTINLPDSSWANVALKRLTTALSSVDNAGSMNLQFLISQNTLNVSSVLMDDKQQVSVFLVGPLT